MKEARKTPVTIIVAVTVILLISYLIIDYFNIPMALGIDISRINIDLLGNVINVVIAIFVFVSGYCLIDRWNVKKVNNQKAIVVVKKSRHEKYLFLICFFKSRHEEYFCRSCFFKSGHGQ